MKTYYVDNKKLIVNSNEIEFEFSISKVEELDDYLIVLIKNTETGDVRKQPNNNIYAVNMNGSIVWNIEKIVKKTEYFPGFTIMFGENGEQLMLAVDCRGINYMINLKDLKIINVHGVK